MEQFLITLLRLSLLGSLLAGLVFLLRPLFRGRVSRAASYYIWLLVLLRLCVPLGITLSLPAVSPVPEPSQAPVAPVAPPQSVAPVTRPRPVEVEDGSLPAPTPVSPPRPSAAPEVPDWTELVDWSIPLAALWAAGALTCLGWYAGSYLLFSKNVKKNSLPPSPQALEVLRILEPLDRVGLVECPLASTPMLLGVVHPVIVLPVGIQGRERLEDILSHELTHARRHDLLYKWFVAGVTSLHWFNPLMLLVRREISRACELSCDEAVVARLDDAHRQHYGQTLLDLAAAPPSGLGLLAITLCEEKAQLKERLISIVNYRKKGVAAVLLTLLLVLSVGGCAMVNAAEIVSSPGEGIVQPGVPDTPPQPAPDASVPAPEERPEGIPVEFWNILTGQAGFVHVTEEGYHWDRSIYTVLNTVRPDSPYAQAYSWTQVDLDGDGRDELILHLVDVAGDMGGFELLRLGEDGQVYGYPAHYKAISQLKTDGSFSWTSPSGYEWGTCTLAFTELGYELHYLTSGSERPMEDPAWYVDGLRAGEEEYRAAEKVQAEKPDAVWQDLPAQAEGFHREMKTIWNVDLDGDGALDTVTAFADWDYMSDDMGSTTLRVTLATGTVLEKQWEEGAFLGLITGRLTAPDRDAIVLQRINVASNYDAAEYDVLEVVSGRLVESLTLDFARQEELNLTLKSGCGLRKEEGSALDSLQVSSLVHKWIGDEWQTFRYTPEGWTHERDGFITLTMDLTVTGGRKLTMFALGPVDEQRPLLWRYDRIWIMDGDTILQTITPEDVVQDENYLFEGFFADWATSTVEVWDINFDGADDIKVLCGTTYNGPVCWFVWDQETQQYQFAFYASTALRVDLDARRLIDAWRDGNLGTDYYVYEYDGQGRRVLVEHYFEPSN